MGRKLRKVHNSNHFLAIITAILILAGIMFIWMATLKIPALEDISERRIDISTRIYDRTGEILLYDMSRDVRRERVTYENISPYVKSATIAVEDQGFYSHNGFSFLSYLRAIWVDIKTLSLSQGGSTLTQQVVKNSILTKDKTPTRKLKELILAIKLEKVLSKEEILTLYLNEAAYGGTVYGIEEASQNFFAKSALDLNLAESAYLAALLKAPSYYSPYGPNREDLEKRKNLVLSEMLRIGFISEEEYNNALDESVSFQLKAVNGGNIRAPHFVFFVIEQLAEKYGEETVREGGFKIITTLDYSIQKDAETIGMKYGPINQETFNAENNAMVAIDPKTGGVLAMTGSKNYFDTDIDGNFNVALAHRQPGSTFKPFVYSKLFNIGYTDQTVLFDTKIQFSPNCKPNDFSSEPPCYSPVNYDDHFRGPITIRNALAQSVNIPAVEALYLAGIKDSVELATSMGIESLTDISNYGLSLVLGGGSVSLLDMTSAYSVFANDGIRNPYNSILWVEDGRGKIIYRHTPSPRRVLSEQTSRTISDILSDNQARTPAYGANSPLYVSSRPVAVKTGTSNDYRDTWIIGYTPNLVMGAWVGNNDNSPMEKKVAGLIVSPLWRELINLTLPKLPVETFKASELNPSDLKPILLGQIGTPAHSILYWVDKNNPRGPQPSNPAKDPQFQNWEYAVTSWYLRNGSLALPSIEN